MDSSFIKHLEIPWHFLNAPLFFLFLIHYLKKEKKNYILIKIALTIFVVLLLIRVGLIYFYNNENLSSLLNRYTVVEEFLSIISSLVIFMSSFYVFKKEKTFSRIVQYNNLNWITNFFYIGAFGYLLWLVPLIITLLLNFNVFIYSYYPLRILTTILIYWLGYQSVIQLRILNERTYLKKQIKTVLNNQVIEEKSSEIINELQENYKINIPEDVVKNILTSLDLFEKKQGYNSQNITLNSLAKELKTNTNYLSKVINHYKKISFSNYLNTLRINNIVALLETNTTIRKFTIKAIAQEAGFNTTDSFSKVFFKIKRSQTF